MTSQVLHQMPWSSVEQKDPGALLTREWLVANGLGGYASGTVAGACTRRYHALLIAALPAPLGRMVMFNHLAEEVTLAGQTPVRLDTEELADAAWEHTGECLAEFRLESGLPVWRYELGPCRIEKRVLLPYLQNTVFVSYRLLAAQGRVRLTLRPSLHFRPHEAPVTGGIPLPYTVAEVASGVEVRSSAAPPLRMRMTTEGTSLVLEGGGSREILYRMERDRGYDHRGPLWCPGSYHAELVAGDEATLVASTEDWDTILAVEPDQALATELQRRERLLAQACPEARQGIGAALVLAADQFIIRPATRVADSALAHAVGDDARTVIAGYHWFTDWGRDTMISLEGLTLPTGRHSEAGYLLRTFGRYVRDGLLPNLFPEGGREGLYHTADATLWYFHALHRYLEATGDRDTLEQLIPTLRSIVEHHFRGTHYGIRIDPADGLLTQGQEGYQLTWMDAKVGDWVVTPRRGKAVELNALWYNALRLLERWNHEVGDYQAAAALAERSEQTWHSFNRRFWHADGGYLFDIVDGEQGDDPCLRPNQLLAISLEHPVLDATKWKPVLDKVAAQLLTPLGMRTLPPGHPNYKAAYDGDLRARDAAYHQGTVWAWLIGPFIDAWMRVHPYEPEKARALLAAFEPHLGEACLGSISEIFDAEGPFTPRGCIAQAWSVAEILRCWVKTFPR